jgi:hypothetical protein
MENGNFINKLVRLFFMLQIHVKQYHWNTNSYARHKATDKFLQKINDNIDKFVEVYIGIYKTQIDITTIRIDSNYLTDIGIEKLLNDVKLYLTGIDVEETDLLNIRDEMLSNINQTLYLFQLN